MSTNPSAKEAEDSVKKLLEFIGEDPAREGLLKTPHRVAKALRELTIGYAQNPHEILSTTFSETMDEMIVVKEIKFWSLCEHHMLPFHGTATVGYLPKDKIVGLSKIGRLIECFSKRLQVQERLTHQIADSMMTALQPKGVGVIIEARHTCMEMRGVKTPGVMVTSCLLGDFRNSETRNEFLNFRKRNLDAV